MNILDQSKNQFRSNQYVSTKCSKALIRAEQTT